MFAKITVGGVMGAVLAWTGMAGAHTKEPAKNAAASRDIAGKKVGAVLANLKVATDCFARAKKAAEAGEAEIAIAECECVKKLSGESERLAGDARAMLHSAHAEAGGDANAPAAPALNALRELHKMALEAVKVAEEAIVKSGMNRDELYAKTTAEAMRTEFGRQLADLTKELAEAEKASGELGKAAAGWEDVDEASRRSLAKIVQQFMPSLHAALKLFQKLNTVASSALDTSVDGADQHFQNLKKEGTTAEKITHVLQNEAGGAIAKFAKDLDELGVPTMKKPFKVAKIRLESLARGGERLLIAAIQVLKPSLRKSVKDKALANFNKLLGAARSRLEGVIAEIEKIQVKMGAEGADMAQAE